jgi:hypothetical protein
VRRTTVSVSRSERVRVNMMPAYIGHGRPGKPGTVTALRSQ